MSLPSEDKLNTVNSRLIFTKACALAFSAGQTSQEQQQGRLPAEVAQNLLNQATELLDISTSRTPLSDRLGSVIAEYANRLKAMLAEASRVTKSLRSGDALKS